MLNYIKYSTLYYIIVKILLYLKHRIKMYPIS